MSRCIDNSLWNQSKPSAEKPLGPAPRGPSASKEGPFMAGMWKTGRHSSTPCNGSPHSRNAFDGSSVALFFRRTGKHPPKTFALMCRLYILEVPYLHSIVPTFVWGIHI
mmetsp:Transcript_4905/g.10549  ORF Transcript_4905/g.10549 Transcript_4905/m.10549 type:complete len:109 (-) Transcript_4905:16-342(-)